MDERIERQEIYCHNCGKYVQFPIDLSMNGNHVLHCPNCGHEHCRVVKDGIITDARWAQRNGPTYNIMPSVITVSTTSSTTSATSNAWTFGSWGTAASASIYITSA